MSHYAEDYAYEAATNRRKATKELREALASEAKKLRAEDLEAAVVLVRNAGLFAKVAQVLRDLP